MVEFLTLGQVETELFSFTEREMYSIKASAGTSSGKKKDTFLSHSSKDARYLPVIIRLLENHGASVYCDLDDDRLPDKPTPQTAHIIKEQIRSSRKLVVFVTKNSKDSKWVPWELGMGDAILDLPHVALLPVSNDSKDQIWARQEYLGLYRHVVYGSLQNYDNDVWMVYDHRTNTGTELSKWIRM